MHSILLCVIGLFVLLETDGQVNFPLCSLILLMFLLMVNNNYIFFLILSENICGKQSANKQTQEHGVSLYHI